MNNSKIRTTAEIGLTVALSAVLGLLAVWHMPQGGSVSFVMLPLFVLAILRGPAVGLIAGALYGVVDFIIAPYPPVHPAQLLLDYPLAFAACGLAGLFAARWSSLWAEGRGGRAFWVAALPGIVIGAVGRYIAHVLSGLIFFAAYAVEAGHAPLIYSLAYNSFVLVSAAACALVAFAVLPPLQRLFASAR